MTNKPKTDQPCPEVQILRGYRDCIITNNTVNPRHGLIITIADGVDLSGCGNADTSPVVASRKKWWEFWK